MIDEIPVYVFTNPLLQVYNDSSILDRLPADFQLRLHQAIIVLLYLRFLVTLMGLMLNILTGLLISESSLEELR
jgi:hypothetical protein